MTGKFLDRTYDLDGADATGVLGIGGAPPETFDLMVTALGKGGLLAFSPDDHALNDPAYEGRLSEWLDIGAARLLGRDYGEHLPGIRLKSNVHVVQRL